MNGFLDKTILPSVKHIVAVASGKGGVGKSTVAANLAVTLAKMNYKTALVDADVYGPSAPKIFGIEKENIGVYEQDGKQLMKPVEKYGVKINSIGFMTDPSQAVIWRGPLAASALAQLFENTVWGDIDYMIVDFPPGTGDIQLSTVQHFKLDASIVVTTPQIIAVNDARRGAEMFSPRKLNIPLIGIVENMSWFTPQEHPEEKYYIFGQGGGSKLAAEFNSTLLTQIPLIKSIGDAAESGSNLMEQNNPTITACFETIAKAVIKAL